MLINFDRPKELVRSPSEQYYIESDDRLRYQLPVIQASKYGLRFIAFTKNSEPPLVYTHDVSVSSPCTSPVPLALPDG